MSHPIEGHRLKCSICEFFFVICSSCYRDHRYCSPTCSDQARERSVQRSGSRYQKSFKGRQNHAQRQKKYRINLASKKIVTHHSSVQHQDKLKIHAGNLFTAKYSYKCGKLSCVKCCVTVKSLFLPRPHFLVREKQFWNTIRSWSQK